MNTNKNFDEGIAYCDRQIQSLIQQKQFIERSIAKWEAKKQSFAERETKKQFLIQKQQQTNDQKFRRTNR